MARFTAFGILACVAASFSRAAPPVNLAGDVDKPLPRERPLTQDDLVYTDNVKPDDAVLHEAGHILFDVVGRSLPNRQGKVIHKFVQNELVRILKDSKDGRWMAVETFGIVKNKGRKQAWVPKSAVKLPAPPSTAPESAASPAPPSEPGIGEPGLDGSASGQGAGLTPGAASPPGAEPPGQGL